MLKIGLEKEFFMTDANNQLAITPAGLPYDDSGFLAEARGEAFTNPTDAVFSLKASCFKLAELAGKLKLNLHDAPVAVIPKQLRNAAARKFAKGIVKHSNIYGFETHRNKQGEHTAGIHISFTNPQEVWLGENKVIHRYYAMFDWLQVFKQLDKAFETEIKESKRNKGFYELKGDGRIEYRSLPANTNLDKIINVLNEILNKK